MAKFECLARVPPDVTGVSYYEGEVYDLTVDQIRKLEKAGHFGFTYKNKVNGETVEVEVEPHFANLSGSAQDVADAQADLFDDGLDELTKEQLIEYAGTVGVTVDSQAKKADILATIRAAVAADKA